MQPTCWVSLDADALSPSVLLDPVFCQFPLPPPPHPRLFARPAPSCLLVSLLLGPRLCWSLPFPWSALTLAKPRAFLQPWTGGACGSLGSGDLTTVPGLNQLWVSLKTPSARSPDCRWLDFHYIPVVEMRPEPRASWLLQGYHRGLEGCIGGVSSHQMQEDLGPMSLKRCHRPAFLRLVTSSEEYPGVPHLVPHHQAPGAVLTISTQSDHCVPV